MNRFTIQDAVQEMTAYIKEKAGNAPSFIVALDGRCASGKTTIASEIARALDATLIHMDDFFLRPEQRTKERLSIPGENIDHERFLTEVLLPLKTGKPFSYRPFSCHTGTLCDSVSVMPKPITIIEGSYACHPSLRPHYDLRLFLTVDPQEQLRRIRIRNGEAGERMFREKWIPLEEAYFSGCHVETVCDRVINT